MNKVTHFTTLIRKAGVINAGEERAQLYMIMGICGTLRENDGHTALFKYWKDMKDIVEGLYMKLSKAGIDDGINGIQERIAQVERECGMRPGNSNRFRTSGMHSTS